MCLLSYNIAQLFPTCFEELKQGCLMYKLENSSNVILVQIVDFLHAVIMCILWELLCQEYLKNNCILEDLLHSCGLIVCHYSDDR